MRSKWAAAWLLLLLLAGTGLVALGTQADSPASYNAEDSYARSHKAMIYLRVLNEDQTVKSVGSGSLIAADGTAATAYHVVKDAASIEAVLSDGRTVRSVKVLAYDERTDAAIVKLPAPKANVPAYTILPVREPALQHGERIYAMGYPLKDTPIITEGIVNSPAAIINGRSRVLVSSEIVSGMSGGPLLDEQGRLAGIISGSLRTMNNIHLVVPTQDLALLRPSK
ncbi:S1 family peptidase [Paenibacillus sp. 1P07SE]|uniref:S1 family peptidase n=1 Tax=Paenibacillus sp. 1P07SE TaxID=3132209 RepID=UPI0039A74431